MDKILLVLQNNYRTTAGNLYRAECLEYGDLLWLKSYSERSEESTQHRFYFIHGLGESFTSLCMTQAMVNWCF
jgi:hypothetical protein